MQKLLAVSLASLFFCSYSNAQNATTCVSSTDGTTNPLTGTQCLDPTDNTIKNILDQGDFGTGRHSSGQSQNQQYNNYTGSTLTSTDYILHFSFTNDTWVTNIAINQALIGAGFDIGGYVAEWEWKNESTNTINGACQAQKVNGECLDNLIITVDVFASGINIYSEEWDYSQTKSNGWTVEDVLSFSPVALVPGVTIDDIEVTISGVDNGYWRGMYGPKVQNLTGSVILMPDACTLNGPLSDPNCPGYANALFQQQCQQSALYDPACPGYATAYLNQQCTINVLYDPACPGYQTAYYNQQCTNDPLSDPGCPDYYVAQCEKDPLYDMGCVGYDTAYYDYQCSLDAQYDQGCTGYVDMTNDQDFVEIFDPVVEEILEEEYTDNIYLSELTVPDFVVEFFEEALDVDIMFVDNEEFEQALEDDIEEEIRLLEQEEPEIEEIFEDESETKPEVVEDTQKDFDDPTNVGGQQDVDDDIEKEIETLEKDAGEGNDKPVEKEGVQEPSSDVRSDTVERPKPDSRREKIRLLIAAKAIEATKELENAITLEQQMDIQRRVLALISFVPDFKDEYTNKELTQVNFYPPKPVVDHQYARWFLNDPNFSTMEDLQYPSLRRE